MLAALTAKLQSLASLRSGTSRPADAQTPEMWMDTTTSTAWALNIWDGTHDICIGHVNSSTGIFTPTSGSVSIAAATGTVDAITATFSPAMPLTDMTVCFVIAAGANTTATPTFAPNGLTAHTITRRGGQALAPGDVAGPGALLVLEYNLANTRWELGNPATIQEPWAVAAGTADVITLTLAPAAPALVDGLCVSFRASGANTVTTPSLNVNGLGAKTIVKQGGQALGIGDIPRALYECICVYNLANTRWELLNPDNPNTALRDISQSYTATHYPAPVALTTTGGHISFDNSIHAYATHTMTETTNLDAMSNRADGQAGELVVTGAGSYTLSATATNGWKMVDGTSFSVSLVAGKKTWIYWECNGTQNLIVGTKQES
jgi:hypothetical protein